MNSLSLPQASVHVSRRSHSLSSVHSSREFYNSHSSGPSEFLFLRVDFSRLVHAEEGRRPAVDVPLPLDEGGEGGDTVPDEVVGLAQDVQVHLGRVGLDAHHLHLRKTKGKKTTRTGFLLALQLNHSYWERRTWATEKASFVCSFLIFAIIHCSHSS